MCLLFGLWLGVFVDLGLIGLLVGCVWLRFVFGFRLICVNTWCLHLLLDLRCGFWFVLFASLRWFCLHVTYSLFWVDLTLFDVVYDSVVGFV